MTSQDRLQLKADTKFEKSIDEKCENHSLCTDRNENSENIFMIYCPQKVSVVFFRCKCRFNFKDFLSVFNRSQPCDVIKCRLWNTAVRFLFADDLAKAYRPRQAMGFFQQQNLP